MVHVLVMLTAGEGGLAALRAYETQVLPVLQAHGGHLLSAFEPQSDGSVPGPDEIHLIEFPSEQAFQAYRNDARVAELADARAQAIGATVLYVSRAMVDYASQR